MDEFNITAVGESIKEIRKALPSVVKGIDDIFYLALGQWFDVLSEKQKIKHKKSLEDFKKNIYEEVVKIPKENLKEPDISILGPTLDASKFYIENSELRNMFAKAAASSVDNRLDNYSRSAFVEIIKQLSPTDIKLIYEIKNKIPIIDIRITIQNDPKFRAEYFKDNVVPDLICEKIKCSYKEVSSSIDNLIRLGIVTRKNGEITQWLLMKDREWFRNNKAISDAYNKINDEKLRLKHQIDLRDHPYETIEYKDGKKVVNKHFNIYSFDLDKELSENSKKDVSCDYNKFIEFTSLGKDFITVCVD
ncbi:DUF4393 domain-containing protein [Apilactobacillus kunkeei]|uniref:DUF4393 domain-containing protein n=1 Tax=Apilactobacillus kunkeei TaxID=148814 RepID=UPI0026595829|nr:DUF4393 domain-containing protein [Apilactobacillus kunkeei]WJV43359.1 DUF4393 domain-containing protein [Apilactobacillus kunkeei]